MKTIWKYTLEITDRQSISMPIRADILSVAVQNDQICLWASVETTEEELRREIVIVGTGNQMPEDRMRFIGTVLTHQDALVWHIYEVL